MKIDVTVNMTLEVEDEEWENWLNDNKVDDADGNEVLEGEPADYLEEFVDDQLSGEEIDTYGGRAWVCAIDDCSIL